ncbi:hypothetical protein C5Y96_05055 [Blastopirellula marina]|uniref:Uncharacterized protein n=1 Tax=Blastopirellula marina TaxID=124 RepID=A0A2S8G452_9BACT|nr:MULTISPECIES: hypothetical protein [Pirellulaceae]PQO39228.1 hypothetical protein C5Y96_05055 [Blastopirellula marina]RCS55536.1 hypothetical protein DTL36_05065 [Bremerella cremea]
MKSISTLQAIKCLSDKLGLHGFPEASAIPAKLAVLRLRFAIHKKYAFSEQSLEIDSSSNEFAELVTAKIESFLTLGRELDPVEMINANNAIQFIAQLLMEEIPIHQRDVTPPTLSNCI